MRIEKETLIITDPCYVQGFARPFINESTIYGDWQCMAYKTSREDALKLAKQWDDNYSDFFHEYNFSGLNKEEKEELYAEYKKRKDAWIEKYCWGEFCADSGRVAVYTLTEIKSRSPLFLTWAKKHPWCVTFVPDYSGEVEYVVGDHEDAHIVGANLYTVQSGV